MKIDKIEIYRLQIPLKRPYKIATAEMKFFDSTIVVINSEGRQGIGEAMAGVEGYFWEKPEEVWQFAKENAPALLNVSIAEGKTRIDAFVEKHPCAATPFLTAMEMVSGNPLLLPPSETQLVPMVGILQATDRAGIEKEIRDFLAQGYGTIKIKVGFDVDDDLQRVKTAQEIIAGKALIRADANQGYDLSSARKFVDTVDPAGIEFLEQPLPENAWQDMAELARSSPLPLGLDESIYGIEAVEKARQLNCAKFVKFKLMKMGSAERLARGIEAARNYGMEVILGNGAAGEITCYHEALVAHKLVTRAGEMNGFLKVRESILGDAIKTRAGKVVLDPNFPLKLGPQKINLYALDRKVFK
ncbi:MAG TPA: enolase C-terminal domain-like protein [Thermodesulfobacteriota bacterium]|nr:enolase C-terminal domain-like protein [Thermodesulfobacteriota bacterium]